MNICMTYLLLQAPDPDSLAERISGMDVAHLLAYALILVCGFGGGTIIYLLRREDKYREQIVAMVQLLTKEDNHRHDIDILLEKLTEHMIRSEATYHSFGEVMRDFTKAAMDMRDLAARASSRHSSTG